MSARPYFTARDSKSYSGAKKIRMISAVHFKFARRRDEIHRMFGAKMKQSEIDSYLASRGITSDQEEISRAIDWVFSAPYVAGRFNDDSFPALYTAKDEFTCMAERTHYLKIAGVKRFEYVLFSVVFGGKLVDLRRTIVGKRWKMPLEHKDCRILGRQILDDGFDGVAAPSARLQSGNCCAIYARSRVGSGEFLGSGMMSI